jgi:phosphatidylserine/phosphatidylglycerophosphate/cardiolipin synthase-like enzyme/membrane protein YqaA with SNARE-associated domain
LKILSENNTHAIKQANRVAMLLDGEAYFLAARQAILSAERQVCILAWDINSAVKMIRGDADDGAPPELGDFLWHVLERKPDLNIYILLWDYSMIYAAEREWNPFSRFKRKQHPRLHFKTDSKLPMGSSHHQKVLVVDDLVGFAGGLDFSVWRWDTSGHAFDDPARRDTRDKRYGPYHDTQLLVDGAAARCLGELFRERWKYGVGDSLDAPEMTGEHDRWPDGLMVDLKDVSIGFSLTRARYDDRPELFQVEQMLLDSIKAARDLLYFENQYLSSHRIMEAIAERLREKDGPEVVIVLTPDTLGWMEESTMGLLRERILEVLDEADKFGRLGVYAPWVEQNGERKQIYVHSKVHIVDDRLIKVGSSNLSNRSMRLDTECDLAIEYADPSPEIRRLRARLLAGYYKLDPEEVLSELDAKDSLRAWIDAQAANDGHSLEPLEYGLDSQWERELADTRLLDPEEPPDPVHWVRRNLPESLRARMFKRGTALLGLLIIALVVFATLGSFWEEIFSEDSDLVTWLKTLESGPQGVMLLIAVFAIGASVGVPLNLLLVLSVLSVGSLQTVLCGISGAFIGAQVGFGLGHFGGKPLVRRFDNQTFARINRYLEQRGLLPIAILRLLPVAPFPVINMTAGATHLPWRTYSLGTLLGMAPGMVAVVALTEQTKETLARPSWEEGLTLFVMGALLVGVILLLRKIWPKGSTAAQ